VRDCAISGASGAVPFDPFDSFDDAPFDKLRASSINTLRAGCVRLLANRGYYNIIPDKSQLKTGFFLEEIPVSPRRSPRGRWFTRDTIHEARPTPYVVRFLTSANPPKPRISLAEQSTMNCFTR
jgi:hypothetical protein